MKLRYIIPFLIFGGSIYSQVETDKSIIFNNNDINLNNINSMGYPIDQTNGVSIKSSVENSITFSNALSSTVNLIEITTSITPLTITEGLIIHFISPLNNTSNVKITVNGQDNYSLLKFGNIELALGDITSGSIVEAVFDGSNFQIMNLPIKDSSCPFGYENINGKYCIQTSANPDLSWFDAVKYCMDREAKLCSWSQFGEACELLNNGSTDYTNSWEWVNTTGDHHEGARVVGFGGCEKGDSENAELKIHKFRCCIEK